MLCAQSCLMLWDPMEGSLSGTFQVKLLERVDISNPGDLPDPGIKYPLLVSPVFADRFFTTVPPGEPMWPLEVTKDDPEEGDSIFPATEELVIKLGTSTDS